MIAALFVERGGPYWDLPDVDAWDQERDARLYRGPWPVVAHPPCKRWGRYWSGGPSAKTRRQLGDDDGCFAAALWAVRTFGGVLEHPEASHAWKWFGLPMAHRGFWSGEDKFGGRSTWCAQGAYGHKARKWTWLYAVNTAKLPDLKWEHRGARLDEGFHSIEERRAARAAGQKPRPRLSSRENLLTPFPFRDLLLDMARSVGPRTAALGGG